MFLLWWFILFSLTSHLLSRNLLLIQISSWSKKQIWFAKMNLFQSDFGQKIQLQSRSLAARPPLGFSKQISKVLRILNNTLFYPAHKKLASSCCWYVLAVWMISNVCLKDLSYENIYNFTQSHLYTTVC